MTTLDNYYCTQAGSGASQYTGVHRFQRGSGRVGDLFGRAYRTILPFLKDIGETLLDSSKDIYNDLASKEDLKFEDFTDSVLKRGSQAIGRTATKVSKRINEMLDVDQSGSGRRRRRRCGPSGIKRAKNKRTGAETKRRKPRTATKKRRKTVKSRKAKTRKRANTRRSATPRKRTQALLPSYLA